MPKLDITSQERSALRAAAHPLRPVVLIGDKGLTESVLKEIDLNLKAHQLIKVRVAGDDREARTQILETICETLSCASVHHLGKTLIIYRPDPQKPLPALTPQKEHATRAVRKPSEPYTPKKLAAAGRTLKKPGRSNPAGKASIGDPKTVPSLVTKSSRSQSSGPASTVPGRQVEGRPSRRPRVAPGIPRRTGSALSLKAGARRRRV